MVASGTVRKALDLTREEPRSRDRYKGVEQFLTARRLIEAGVGCVTLAYGGWDTHGENFKTLRRQLPKLDRGIANLIQDLHDRGMDNDVVTVMWGEFGRTPKIGDSTPDGRDHWPPVMSALVAGGGLKMGQAIGTTTPRGEVPKDRRYTRSAGPQHHLPAPWASTRRRRSPTAAAGRCTSSTTATRSSSCCKRRSDTDPLSPEFRGEGSPDLFQNRIKQGPAPEERELSARHPTVH